MFGKIVKTIELKFWDVMIPILSNSSWLRDKTSKVVEFTKNENFLRQIGIALLIACAGFASGFLFFTLTSLFS